MNKYIYLLIALLACSGCKKKERDISLDNIQTIDNHQSIDAESAETKVKEILLSDELEEKVTPSSETKIEQRTVPKEMEKIHSEENEYLSIAKDTVKNINIPVDVIPELTESGDHTLITWSTDSVPEKEGFLVLSGDYHAKVKIETKTKKVVEVLVAP